MDKPTDFERVPRLERALEALLRAPEPDARFVAGLERRLLSDGVKSAPKPQGRALWRRTRPRLRAFAQGIAAIVVLVALVTGLSALFEQLSRSTPPATPTVLAAPETTDTAAATPTLVAEPERTGTLPAPTATLTDVPVPEARDGPITIRFACFRLALPNLEDLAAAFQEEHPEIRVELLDSSDLFDYESGTSQDWVERVVLTTDASCWQPSPETSALGYIRDLRPFIEADAGFGREDFHPGTIEAYQWDGGTWALPLQQDVMLIYYDKAAFDAAGLPYPLPGWTYADLASAAEQLTVREGGQTVRYGFLNLHGDWAIRALIEGRAGPLLDGSLEPAAINLDRPETIEALRWYSDLILEHDVMPNHLGLIDEEGNYQPALHALRDGGKAAMWTDSPVNWRHRSESFDLGAAPLPDGAHPAALRPTLGYVMSSGTPHPEETWLWMRYLSRHYVPDYYGDLDLDEMPVRRSLAEVSGYWSQWEEAEVTEAIRHTLGQRPVSVVDDCTEALQEAIEAVLGGESVEDVLAEAQARAAETRRTRLAAMVGSSPTAVTTPTPDGRLTFTFAPYGPDTQLYRELATQFQEEHPGIAIQFLRPDQAAEADCFSRVGGGAEAKRDLTPFLLADPALSHDAFYSRPLDAFRRGEVLLGLPTYSQLKVVFYNTDLFDAAGLPYPEPGWTVDEFVGTAIALTQGEGENARYGWISFGNEALDLDLWVALQGAESWEVGPPPRPRYDAPQVVDAVQGFADLFLKHQVTPLFPPTGLGGVEATETARDKAHLIRDGRVAMWTGYTSENEVAFEGMDYGIAPMPRGVGQATQFLDAGLFISANAEHAEACWTWITYASAHLLPPGLPARRATAASKAWQRLAGEEAARSYLASAEYANACNSVAFQELTVDEARPYTEAHGEFYQAFAEILSGADAVAALQAAQERAQARLDAQPAIPSPGYTGTLHCGQVNPLDPACNGALMPDTPPPIETIHRFLHAARAGDYEDAQFYWVQDPPGGWDRPEQREAAIRQAMGAADWYQWGMKSVSQWIRAGPAPPYPVADVTPEDADGAIVRMIPVQREQPGGYAWTVLKEGEAWLIWRLEILTDEQPD